MHTIDHRRGFNAKAAKIVVLNIFIAATSISVDANKTEVVLISLLSRLLIILVLLQLSFYGSKTNSRIARVKQNIGRLEDISSSMLVCTISGDIAVSYIYHSISSCNQNPG